MKLNYQAESQAEHKTWEVVKISDSHTIYWPQINELNYKLLWPFYQSPSQPNPYGIDVCRLSDFNLFHKSKKNIKKQQILNDKFDEASITSGQYLTTNQ